MDYNEWQPSCDHEGARWRPGCTRGFWTGQLGILQEMAYHTGAPIEGLNFKSVDGGWLLIVKARSARRGALVAFFGGRDPDECLEAFWAQACVKPGVHWKPDKYVKKPYDK